jgi:predicted alpha/beta-hydrolase family hydrolase
LPESSIREFVDTAVEPHVRGFLHTPAKPNGNGLVLTHGAGSNAQAPLLRALADAFCAAGFTVLRCDLPYRQVRSYGPPGPGDAARDRAGLKNAIAALKTALGAPLLADFARRGNSKENEVKPHLSRSSRQGGDSQENEGSPPNVGFVGWEGRIFLAGHSYGGRQSSMLCAEQPDLVTGLLLLSYPLHPPRRSEQQRTQHLPDLRTPVLFVHGTRDPFGSIAEIEQAIKMIPAKTKLLTIEGAGHDLGFKGKAKLEELPRLIFSEFAKFFELSS